MAADRITQLRDRVAKKPLRRRQGPARAAAPPRHDAGQARRPILDRPQIVAQPLSASNNSLPARYARAIARNCPGSCAQAIGEVDALIRERPDNPYFWELKGELSHGRPSARGHRAAAQGRQPAREAEARQCDVSLSQAHILLARALIDANDPGYSTRRSRSSLDAGADKPLGQGEDDDWMGWYQLAVAYQRRATRPRPSSPPPASTSTRATLRISRGPDLCQARPGQACPRLARLAQRRRYHHLQDPDLSRLPGLP